MMALIRFAYAIVLPFAGFLLLRSEGWRVPPVAAVGIAFGIYLYHYLQWALCETFRSGDIETDRARTSLRHLPVLASVIFTGLLVEGSWRDWLIEQLLLEFVAFSAGLGLLAIYKAAREGKDAPWFLVILVFAAPAGVLVWKILPAWASRHTGASLMTWIWFTAAFLSGVVGVFFQMKPFAMGHGLLAEPLNRRWKMILACLWLAVVFTLAFSLVNRSGATGP